MTELGPTGSIKVGYGMATLLERMARPDEITTVTDPLRLAWQAAAGLFQHIDNREDADAPDSYPEGTYHKSSHYESTVWAPYIQYLRRAGTPGDDNQLPGGDEKLLTVPQEAAFVTMHDALAGLPDAHTAILFTHHVERWIDACRDTKRASDIFGQDGYVAARATEAKYLGGMFVSLVDEDSHGLNFGRFTHRTQRIARAAKMADSFIDLPTDVRHENTDIEHVTAARLAVAAISVKESAIVALTNPDQVAALARKALLSIKNRHGDHNQDRIHQ